MTERVTPMLEQYRRLKSRHPDALLLFRLGDFYELFEEDARIAARELQLVLTSRSFSKDVRLPMCGVPHHSVTSYIARLIERGYKVAVVEQLEDPRKARGLVKRDIVRVITPGTVVEEELLKGYRENFLVAIAHRKQGYGLSFVDLSTGEFATCQITGPGAWDLLIEELHRLRPSEYILPEGLSRDERVRQTLLEIGPARISPLDEKAFDPEIARARLLEHFGVLSLEAFGCAELPLAIAASGAILQYLKENQPSAFLDPRIQGQSLMHLQRLVTYSPEGYMLLDGITRRNLELTESLRDGTTQGSLLDVLDHTVTPMGRRLLRRWINQPLLDLSQIHERLDAVGELVEDNLFRGDLRAALEGMSDVERLTGRIGFGTANARDLVALKRSLLRLPRIKEVLQGARTGRLVFLRENLDDLQDVCRTIEEAIVEDPPIQLKEGGLIKPGYSADLDHLREVAARGKGWLAELEAAERARTGIKGLRIRYNEVFGFFLEVPRSQSHLVPPEYERRATITHAERFITPALRAKEGEILGAEERIRELEYELFVEVRTRVAREVARLQETARILAELDVLASLAEAAARYGYVKPIVDEGDEIEIREGRHPVVERYLPEGKRFVPNDTMLNLTHHRLILLTGPNMSGKSVYIRQVALIVLMAQMGSFVPASHARIGLVDRIFSRVGATDDISQGRSTFLVEMSETSYILHHATTRSLVILDEVGRGTSTYDGISLAWAVAEYLHNHIGAKTLFATHFHELTRLAGKTGEEGRSGQLGKRVGRRFVPMPHPQLPGAKNYTMAVKEQGSEILFLYRVIPGTTDRSYGIHVAQLAGLPAPVISRAQEILQILERANGAVPLREGEGEVIPFPRVDEARGKVLDTLASVDIASTTPLEALNLLYHLQQQVREARVQGMEHLRRGPRQDLPRDFGEVAPR